MAFRLRIESLESRDNPSGPSLLDPTAPPAPEPQTPPPAEPPSQLVSGAQQVIDNTINYLLNPQGYIS